MFLWEFGAAALVLVLPVLVPAACCCLGPVQQGALPQLSWGMQVPGYLLSQFLAGNFH